MLYPVVIHKEAGSDYGVIVPDLPGCISAGETYEQALAEIKEAIALHLECMLDDDETFPQPQTIEHHQADQDYAGGTWALVDVNIDALMGPKERINITASRRELHAIDAAAQQAGMNRSRYLIHAALVFSAKGSGGRQIGKDKAG